MSEKAAPRVLLVEDAEEISSLLKHLLERAGFAVAIARDGKQALDYVTKEAPVDLAVLDILLPYYSGFDLVKTGWTGMLPSIVAIAGGLAGGWVSDRMVRAIAAAPSAARSGTPCASPARCADRPPASPIRKLTASPASPRAVAIQTAASALVRRAVAFPST